jgi:hypothetical protein
MNHYSTPSKTAYAKLLMEEPLPVDDGGYSADSSSLFSNSSTEDVDEDEDQDKEELESRLTRPPTRIANWLIPTSVQGTDSSDLCEWLADRDMKALPLDGGKAQFEPNKTTIFGPCYKEDELAPDNGNHPDQNPNPLLIARVMDCPKQFCHETAVFYRDRGMTFSELMTLRPETFVSSKVLEIYVRWLNTINQKGIYLIGPETARKANRLRKVAKTELQNKILKCAKVLLVLLHDTTQEHYVILEIMMVSARAQRPCITYCPNSPLVLWYLSVQPRPNDISTIVSVVDSNFNTDSHKNAEVAIKEIGLDIFLENTLKPKQVVLEARQPDADAYGGLQQGHKANCGIMCLQRMYSHINVQCTSTKDIRLQIMKEFLKIPDW